MKLRSILLSTILVLVGCKSEKIGVHQYADSLYEVAKTGGDPNVFGLAGEIIRLARIDTGNAWRLQMGVNDRWHTWIACGDGYRGREYLNPRLLIFGKPIEYEDELLVDFAADTWYATKCQQKTSLKDWLRLASRSEFLVRELRGKRKIEIEVTSIHPLQSEFRDSAVMSMFREKISRDSAIKMIGEECFEDSCRAVLNVLRQDRCDTCKVAFDGKLDQYHQNTTENYLLLSPNLFY